MILYITGKDIEEVTNKLDQCDLVWPDFKDALEEAEEIEGKVFGLKIEIVEYKILEKKVYTLKEKR